MLRDNSNVSGGGGGGGGGELGMKLAIHTNAYWVGHQKNNFGQKEFI